MFAYPPGKLYSHLVAHAHPCQLEFMGEVLPDDEGSAGIQLLRQAAHYVAASG